MEVGGFESGPGVVRVPQLSGVEDAEGSEGIRKVAQPAIELVFEEAATAVPLALDDGEAGAQVYANVRRATTAATLGAGRETMVAEELGKEYVGGFFSDGFAAGWHRA